MKVYQEATKFAPEKNSKWVSEEYAKHSRKIAKIVSELVEMKSRVDYLHSLTMDNGDVSMSLEDVITKAGIALSSCVEYAAEYADEAAGMDESEIEKKWSEL